MSELMENNPSLTFLDAEQGALEQYGSVPQINFDDIAQALEVNDPILKATDYDHYEQELRIADLNLSYLSLAKQMLEDHDYPGCRSCLHTIIELVQPTGNMYLLDLLRHAHDQLYR